MHSIVYLTCEVKSRDLESRLLIAAHLLKRGVPVIVGQQWAMTGNRPQAMRGCMLFKTVNTFQAREMKRFRNAGFAIAAADEESLPFADDGFLVNIEPAAPRHMDVFLALHDGQRDILRAKFPNLPITVTGSPRIDILRGQQPPRPMAEPYILFNTNFALTNSVWGDAQTAIDSLIAGGGLDRETEAGRTEIQTRYDFEVSTRKELMELIGWCTENLPIATVVRPHPAELASTWNAMAGKNLHIVSGSAPIPWIAHANIVVHANSTTGLEAAILGTPCLNISPPQYDQWVAQFVMRGLNDTAVGAQDGAEKIVAFLKTGRGLASRAEAAGFLPGGAERTAEALIALLASRNAVPAVGEIKWERFARTDVQRNKFTVTKDEFGVALEDVARGLNLPSIHIEELDDSIVLMVPS